MKNGRNGKKMEKKMEKNGKIKYSFFQPTKRTKVAKKKTYIIINMHANRVCTGLVQYYTDLAQRKRERESCSTHSTRLPNYVYTNK